MKSPVSLSPEISTECTYAEWSITAESRGRLVNILAYLYLRQEENALRVINAIDPKAKAAKGKVPQNVIRKLTAPDLKDVAVLASVNATVAQKEKAQNRIDVSISHRDGLLFQHISWVVARVAVPAGYMTSPHVRQADKGFDGFIIELNATESEVKRIILCEDKASIKPRTLICNSVWPEITAIQTGDRDDEILAELVTLLKGVTGIDPEAAVDEVLWEESREFRVAVATGENRRKKGSFLHVVAGFEKAVGSPTNPRSAGVLPFQDVRTGLAQLASEVIDRVKEISGV